MEQPRIGDIVKLTYGNKLKVKIVAISYKVYGDGKMIAEGAHWIHESYNNEGYDDFNSMESYNEY